MRMVFCCNYCFVVFVIKLCVSWMVKLLYIKGGGVVSMYVFKEVFVFSVFFSVIVVVLFFIIIFFLIFGWCLYFFSCVLLNECVIVCCLICLLNILRGCILEMKVVYKIDNVSFCVVCGVCSLLNLLNLGMIMFVGLGVNGCFVLENVFLGCFEFVWEFLFLIDDEFGCVWLIVIWDIIEVFFCVYG